MNRHPMLSSAVRLSFILPAMAILLLLTAYPLYLVFQMSFYDYSTYAQPTFAGFMNYVNVLRDEMFWVAFRNTLVFTFASLVLTIVTGMGFAVLLNQKVNAKVRAVFRSVLMFPWLISSAVVGSLWVLMLSPFGLFNWILQQFGLISEGIAWLSEERFAMAGLVIANVWRGFPFAMLMILAAFQTVPDDIQEAALVDGANRTQRFLHIVLPSIRGILFTITTLELIWTFRVFDLVFLMTGGGPVHSTENLSTYVYFNAFRSLDFGHASATAIFMLGTMVCISVFYIRNILKREA